MQSDGTRRDRNDPRATPHTHGELGPIGGTARNPGGVSTPGSKRGFHYEKNCVSVAGGCPGLPLSAEEGAGGAPRCRGIPGPGGSRAVYPGCYVDPLSDLTGTPPSPASFPYPPGDITGSKVLMYMTFYTSISYFLFIFHTIY